MSSIGATLGGKYLLQKELGRGGMGAVYVATNTWTGRSVAIKTLRAEVARSQQVLDRFWQEGRAASRLQHPNIIDVLDMGWDEASGEPFLVQEYLEGSSLEQHLKRAPGGRLSPEEALALLLPVAGALMACHRAGILHRDVKPSNIIITTAQDGSVCPKLIDFGISKELCADPDAVSYTVTGVPMGSPAYMSPEQARGDRAIDPRTDVWAFGATLFEALTGRRPFVGSTVAVVIAKVIYEPPPRVASVVGDVPGDVAAVVDAMLVHDRDHRLPSMDVVVAELLACAAARADIVRAVAGFSRAVADAFNESASGERVRAFVVGSAAPPSAVPALPVVSTQEPWSRSATPKPRPSLSVPFAIGIVAVLVAAFAGVWHVHQSAATVAPPLTDASPIAATDAHAAVYDTDAAAQRTDAMAVDASVTAHAPDARAPTPRRVERPATAPVAPPPRTRVPSNPLAPDDDPYEATQ